MVHIPYNPTVHLLCQKCRKPTAHTMTGFSNNPLSALSLIYECQECGEIKKIFDLNTLPELKVPVANEAESKETQQNPDAQPIPIERGPQISS